MVMLADLTAVAAAAAAAAAGGGIAANTTVRFTDGVLSKPHCCKLPAPPQLHVAGPVDLLLLLLLLLLLCSLPLPWSVICSIVA
jgi:hypothetical protein